MAKNNNVFIDMTDEMQYIKSVFNTDDDELTNLYTEVFNDVVEHFVGYPNLSSTYEQIKNQVQNTVKKIVENSITGTTATITYVDELENADPVFLSGIVEERLTDFIYAKMDRYYVQECGSCVYSVIVERAYEEIDKLLQEEGFNDENEKLSSEIMDNIDFESLYEIIDDILNAPITMEEKLAEIGMSQKDFL